MPLQFSAKPDGIHVPIFVRPGARREAVTGEHDGRLRVAVTAAPEKGKANRAAARLLANCFGLRKSAVRILSGHTSSKKVVLLAGLAEQNFLKRVAELTA